jgi:membrane-bound ClpP family serine protease
MDLVAVLVVVFGLLELMNRGFIERAALRSPTVDQWRGLLGAIAVVLLIVDHPGRVLPDNLPVLSLGAVLGMAVLTTGAQPVRRGAFAGLGVSVFATSGLLGDSNYVSTTSVPTSVIVALAICAFGLFDFQFPNVRPTSRR